MHRDAHQEFEPRTPPGAAGLDHVRPARNRPVSISVRFWWGCVVPVERSARSGRQGTRDDVAATGTGVNGDLMGSRHGTRRFPQQKGHRMRYTVSGYEDYPVLHLIPVDGDTGVELPTVLYQRWRQARKELDAVQREVLAHLRSAGGRSAIPEELWETIDRPEDASSAGWDSW